MSSGTDIGPVFDALQHGTAVERESALQQLRARAAAEPEDPSAVRDFAVGLSMVGRTAEAVGVLRDLVDRYPDEAGFEADLGMAQVRFGNLAMARHHLERVVERGSPELRRYASEQLEALDRFELRGEDERLLRRAQIAVLRERVAGPEPSIPDAVVLARKLLRDAVHEQDDALRREAVATLERARAAAPDAVEVLELLVTAYLTDDPDGRLGPTLRDLEQLEPQSQVLDILRGSEGSSGDYPLAGRAYELLAELSNADPALRAAVLHDLGSVVAMTPENGSNRIAYALALAIEGQHDVAREQARLAEPWMDDDFADHFNLSAALRQVGDLQAARRHAMRTVELAANDEELQLAEALLAEAGPDE